MLFTLSAPLFIFVSFFCITPLGISDNPETSHGMMYAARATESFPSLLLDMNPRKALPVVSIPD